MLAFYETASTQDEGHYFSFGFNEAAICVRETHMATKCRKPLETEECLWSEASRLCSPDATKELNFTAHLEFGGRFFPRQVSVWKCAAQPTPGLQFWDTLRTSEAVPGLLILRNCDSCIDFSCQVQSYSYVAPFKRVHQQLLARFRKWLTYKILDRGQTNSCIYLLFQLEHHLSDSRLPSPAR